jgi:hypothetical protein
MYNAMIQMMKDKPEIWSKVSYTCSRPSLPTINSRLRFLKNIADHEHVHAGSFSRLLRELSPKKKKVLRRRSKKSEAEIKKMKHSMTKETIK